MLEQIFSTVYIHDHNSIEEISRKDNLSEKYDNFRFIFKALSEDSFNKTTPEL